MIFRAFIFFVLVVFCVSCDKFSFSKNKDLQDLDTIVDFTSVDFSPSFKICDAIIDKDEIAICFRNTIHQKIGAELQQHSLTIKDSIDELIYVDVLINSKGEIIFDETSTSENIKEQLPKLDSILKESVKNLPKIHPAIKRGIPVTTKYRLPIRILFKD
ncbi:hypothetical protein BST83_12810 [Polaribacter filamentus]|jgi:hypothetical protein|uniref:TonB C-terminal domain-containing protein n=1 Tax=Polaribacter filamentus TaxID=53483 RepID=A0A2S7KZ90_9FLAO|nr:hypothetical protein [Polaribacter filamentus]PQB07930.1 hypothetical protein BST83_12810 [Polaribacter filamentus]